jgi:hypothetical protein
VSSNAARDVAGKLREIRRLAESEAPMAACRALGQVAETAVKVTLTSSTHQEGTPTPSRPGQPPSLVTGALRRSYRRTPPRLAAAGFAMCQVGSLLLYAPVHEFGPVTITSKGKWPLRNPNTGQVFGRQVTIPKRPALATAVKNLQATGIARRACEDAWRLAMKL